MPSLKELTDLVAGRLNKQEEELIVKAYKFAERAHEGQKRLSGEPYFNHVFETAKILVSLGMDTQTIVSGFLHDVLEDTKVTEEELEKEFGSEVLFLVNGVTTLRGLKYRGRERHVESLRKFFFAMAHDLRVVIIKFADRLHNLRTLQHLREDKRRRISIESIEVYAPLASRLGMGRLKGEIEDITLDKDTKIASVKVADNQLSLAIGRNGQNVRLAAKLTGWKIDIVSSATGDKISDKKTETKNTEETADEPTEAKAEKKSKKKPSKSSRKKTKATEDQEDEE